MAATASILIVDDDDDILTAGRLLLRREFGEVLTCRNPVRQAGTAMAGADTQDRSGSGRRHDYRTWQREYGG